MNSMLWELWEIVHHIRKSIADILFKKQQSQPKNESHHKAIALHPINRGAGNSLAPLKLNPDSLAHKSPSPQSLQRVSISAAFIDFHFTASWVFLLNSESQKEFLFVLNSEIKLVNFLKRWKRDFYATLLSFLVVCFRCPRYTPRSMAMLSEIKAIEWISFDDNLCQPYGRRFFFACAATAAGTTENAIYFISCIWF